MNNEIEELIKIKKLRDEQKSFNEIKIEPLPNPNQFGEVDETFAKKRDLIGNIVLDYTKTDSDIYIDIRKDEEDDCILPGIF